MKYAVARAQQKLPAKVEEPARAEMPIDSYTLVYERQGPLSRGRLILPDGSETVTEWRRYDHGMVASVHELYQRWRRAGILGGLGRIPRGAARTR